MTHLIKNKYKNWDSYTVNLYACYVSFTVTVFTS